MADKTKDDQKWRDGIDAAALCGTPRTVLEDCACSIC